MKIPLPEQVWIDLEPAGFGSRAIAYILDLFFRWSFILVIIIALATVGKVLGGLNIGAVFAAIKEYAGNYNVMLLSFVALLLLFVEWSYPLYFDLKHDGVSPGKKIMGLRVVDERGLPITMRSSLLRTTLLLVDLLPGMGAVAFVSMLFSDKSQRLGDLVARTMVIHEGRQIGLDKPQKDPKENGPRSVIPTELYTILEKYRRRREEFSDAARTVMRDKLISAVRSSCPQIQLPPLLDPSAQDSWLDDLYLNSRPTKLTTGCSKEDHTIDWSKIHDELREVEAAIMQLDNHSRRLGPRELHRIGTLYRLICQRSAYLSAFYPSTLEALKAVRLVRSGRRLIYSRRLEHNAKAAEGFFARIPARFAEIKRYCALSAALGVISAALAAAIVQLEPELVWHFLSEDISERLAQGSLWTEDIKGTSAIAASGIMVNNIKVTLAAFALGVTCGVGTALVLIFNGIHIGGIFSALAHYEMAGQLADFVTAHGFLELSVIAVAGGCGLFLGDALLRPGSLSRKKALQHHAAVVFDLLIFNALCLVPAGLVEGFISPYSLNFELKLMLGILLGGGYWFFLFGGTLNRRTEPHKRPERFSSKYFNSSSRCKLSASQ